MEISLDYKFEKDLKEYCKLNLLDINDFLVGLIKDGFMKEKYGDRPFIANKNSLNKKKKEKISYIFEPEVKNEVAKKPKRTTKKNKKEEEVSEPINEDLKNPLKEGETTTEIDTETKKKPKFIKRKLN